MLSGVINSWRQHFTLGKVHRHLMYQIIETQLKAGVTPQSAFSSMRTLSSVSPAIVAVASRAAYAGEEGRLVVAGMAESGCIPEAELGVLTVAERHNTLASALANIRMREHEKLSLFQAVVGPNLYYLTIAAVLLFFSWQAAELLALAPHKDISQVPAYQFSMTLRQYGPVALVALGGYLVLVSYASANWVGIARRSLVFFDPDYRANLAVKVADLGEALYAQGVNHTEFLDVVDAALSHQGYVKWAIAAARQKYVGDGESIERSIAGSLLPENLAVLLEALAPGSEQPLYAPAWQAVSTIQRAELKAKYQLWMSVFRTLVLSTVAFLILLLAHGLYSALLI